MNIEVPEPLAIELVPFDIAERFIVFGNRCSGKLME